MRKVIEWTVALGGLGTFLLSKANWIANHLSFLSLSDDMRWALILMSKMPTYLAVSVFLVGVSGLGFLIHDYGIIAACSKSINRFNLRFRGRKIHEGHDRELISKPKSASVDEYVSSENWQKLYEEYEAVPTRKELRLRFLPDTGDQSSDALLLICYGYKLIKHIDSIPMNFAHSQIEYLLRNAPNTRESPTLLFSVSISGERRDFGKKYINQGYIERIALSQGGRYTLTALGENLSRSLSRDMIRRA